jgi:hypothetical protein
MRPELSGSFADGGGGGGGGDSGKNGSGQKSQLSGEIKKLFQSVG